jgi:hypothetical protein
MNYGDPRLPDRYWDKVVPVPESGCWLWIGALPSGPQIRWKVDGAHKTLSAKRVAFEAVHGPQSAPAIGGCIDACVCPDHMIAGTTSEITIRVAARRPRGPMCRYGHEREVVGYYITYENGRAVHHCRACHAKCVAIVVDRKRRRRLAHMKPERRQEWLAVSARLRAGWERKNGPSLRTLYYPEGATL